MRISDAVRQAVRERAKYLYINQVTIAALSKMTHASLSSKYQWLLSRYQKEERSLSWNTEETLVWTNQPIS